MNVTLDTTRPANRINAVPKRGVDMGWRAMFLTLTCCLMFAPPLALCAEPPDETKLLFDGKSLKGWKAASKFDFEKHGKVAVVDGELRMAAGQPATGVVCQAKLPRDNYELTLEAKRVEGGDFFCGLTFPVGKEHCTLIVGGWGGGVIGLSNVDNTSAVENETTGYQAFKSNQWYKIRLRVTPKRIEAWIDKKQVVELEREDRKFSVWWEQEPMRPLGIANWNTGSALRKIRFRDLDKKRAAAERAAKKAKSNKTQPRGAGKKAKP